jgi:hypothetical protein
MLWWWLVPIAVGLTVLPHVSPLDRRHSPEPGQHGVQGSAGVLTARPICQQSSGEAFKRVQPLWRSGYRAASTQQRNRRHRSRGQSIPEDTA